MSEELSGWGICKRQKKIVLATMERHEKRVKFILWLLWASAWKEAADVKSLGKNIVNTFRGRWIYVLNVVTLSEFLECCHGTSRGACRQDLQSSEGTGMFLRVSIAHRAMELPNVMHLNQASWDLLMLAWLSAGFSGTQAGGGKMWQVFGL